MRQKFDSIHGALLEFMLHSDYIFHYPSIIKVTDFAYSCFNTLHVTAALTARTILNRYGQERLHCQ